MSAKIKNVLHHKNRRHRHKPKGLAKHDFEKVYWPYLPLILVIGFLLSLSVQSGSLKTALSNPTAKTLDYATSMNVDQLLNQTNAQRTQNGAAPLKLSNKLYAAAQAKANDMSAKNYWSHYTPEGNAPWVFVAAQQYDYQKLGENLATGFLDESGTIKGWMASEGHRRNLLDPLFSEVGFGIANNPNYSSAGGGPMTIIVAMYGKPLVASVSTVTTPAPAESPAPAANLPAPKSVEVASQPANTETLTPSSGTVTQTKVSGAQIALASLPFAPIASSLFLVVMLATIGLWLTKHAFAIRRVWIHGERFIIKHPMIDIGLIVVAVLSLLLTKTVGLVG